MGSETNELNHKRFYEYDLADNLTSYTDRNGRVIEYEYNHLYRRVAEAWLDGVPPIHKFEYAYDAASQLIFAGDSFAEYVFSCDALGRVTSSEHSLAAFGFDVIIDQAYDAIHRRIGLSATVDGTADLVNTVTVPPSFQLPTTTTMQIAFQMDIS